MADAGPPDVCGAPTGLEGWTALVKCSVGPNPLQHQRDWKVPARQTAQALCSALRLYDIHNPHCSVCGPNYMIPLCSLCDHLQSENHFKRLKKKLQDNHTFRKDLIQDFLVQNEQTIIRFHHVRLSVYMCNLRPPRPAFPRPIVRQLGRVPDPWHVNPS